MSHIFASFKESLASVLPIALIVLILSVTCVTLDAGVMVLFLFGTILLILGMSFFTVGSGISMEPLGDGIGKSLNRKMDSCSSCSLLHTRFSYYCFRA